MKTAVHQRARGAFFMPSFTPPPPPTTIVCITPSARPLLPQWLQVPSPSSTITSSSPGRRFRPSDGRPIRTANSLFDEETLEFVRSLR